MRILSCLAGALLLAGCATAQTNADAVPATAKNQPIQSPAEAIAAAKQANKKAASVDHEWRDTAKVIKKAETAAAEGDEKLALKLAEQAKLQAEQAYIQGTTQKDVGPRF